MNEERTNEVFVPLESEFYFDEQDLRNVDEPTMLSLINSQGWHVFYYASNMHDKKDIVMKAVKIDGKCLKWASKELKNDREVALEAIKQDWEAIMDVGIDLRSDKSFILEAMKINPKVYYFITSYDLKHDDELIEMINKYDNNAKNIEQSSAEVNLSIDKTGKTR